MEEGKGGKKGGMDSVHFATRTKEVAALIVVPNRSGRIDKGKRGERKKGEGEIIWIHFKQILTGEGRKKEREAPPDYIA